MRKLNQVLAIEKGIKNRVTSRVTQLRNACQKSGLFNGFSKEFRPKEEGGETFPPERHDVQFRTGRVQAEVQKHLVELFDITASKDYANCEARANVEADGTVLLENVPVTYLLFLEKQLEHLGTVIDSLPTLDTAVRWKRDEATGQYVSDEQVTHRTAKVQRPITLAPATKEHPAQTQLVTEDQVIGHWHQRMYSGAMPVEEKEKLQERVVHLQEAVKQAREEANSAEAPPVQVGAKVLNYIFG